jgi:TfoX/Sxy family transcriptional regulator of competence genes
MTTKDRTGKPESGIRADRKWKKAPAELVQLFESEVARLGVAQVKKMFGYPAGFVNGNMLAGVFEDSIMFRLGEPELQRFMQSGHGKQFEPMPGRIMKEYVATAPEALRDLELVRYWLEQALAHTSQREPKSAARKPPGKRSRQKPG